MYISISNVNVILSNKPSKIYKRNAFSDFVKFFDLIYLLHSMSTKTGSYIFIHISLINFFVLIIIST